MREAVRECREVLCAVIAQVLRAEPIAERRVLVTEQRRAPERAPQSGGRAAFEQQPARSAEHTSELQSLMRISSAVLCLKTKINITIENLSLTRTLYEHK